MKTPSCVLALCLLAPLTAAAATRYVDNTLAVATCADYDPTTRSCGHGSANAYRDIQTAQNAAQPGDIVEVRGGQFNLASRQQVVFDRAGSAGHPIVYRNYRDEEVILKGPYDTDSDGDGIRDWDENNGLGDAKGPSDVGDRAAVLTIKADYVQVRGLRIQWVYSCGVISSARFVVVEEVVCHDSWIRGFGFTGTASDNLLRYVASFRVRHGSAVFEIGDVQTDLLERNVVARSLVFKNGRQLPSDAIVLPFGSDSAGGGNSDGLSQYKNCIKSAPDVFALCRGGGFVENISWRNADDCYDSSVHNFHMIGNIAYDCGPRGAKAYKLFEPSTEFVFSGNIAVGFENMTRGLELRWADSDATGTSSFALHNLTTRVATQGLYIAGAGEGAHCFIQNNLMWGNGPAEYARAGCVTSNDYNGDTSGTPALTDPSFEPRSSVDAAEACLQNAPHNVTVESCWKQLYDAFYNAFKPSAGSATVDGGVVVPTYHCSRPDPAEPSTSACRHWAGTAPDQGPFEHGIDGDPDKTWMRFSNLAAHPPANLRLLP